MIDIMKTQKADNRDKKRSKRQYGMRVSGKSLFILEEIKVKKAQKADSKK